jgi:hypothetical protein
MAVLTIFGLAVHFVAGMAINTSHSALSEMNIRFQIFMFTQELIPDAAPMAGSAVICHGWFSFEDMAIDETSRDRCWPADMAVTAGCVTASTVVAEHLFSRRMVLGHTPL